MDQALSALVIRTQLTGCCPCCLRCSIFSRVSPAHRQVGGAEGIVNGMDVTEWNPKTDKYVPVKYDRTTVFEGKAAAKAALQAEMGLPVDPTAPLFGYIGRLEEQKGVDILLAVSDDRCWWLRRAGCGCVVMQKLSRLASCVPCSFWQPMCVSVLRKRRKQTRTEWSACAMLQHLSDPHVLCCAGSAQAGPV